MFKNAFLLSIGVALIFTSFAQKSTAQTRWVEDAPKLPMAKTWLEYKKNLAPFEPPRTANGEPDLQGYWGGAGGGGADDIENHEYIDSTTPAQESFISSPADGNIPYTEKAEAEHNRIRAGLARGWAGESGERLYSDPAAFCMDFLGPRTSLAEIIQTENSIVFLQGLYINPRIIKMDQSAAGMSENATFWRGISRGHWEGDTLVVDVTNLNGKHWFDSVGNFYTAKTHMTERLTLVEANTIDYSLTIDDPSIYSQPWVINYPIRRMGTGGLNRENGDYAWNDTIAPLRDEYLPHLWETSCEEGIGMTVIELNTLGFEWYKGVEATQ